MNKLDLHSGTVTNSDTAHSHAATPGKDSVNIRLETARRLIVLVPADADYDAATRRVWELANTSGACVLFLGLCHDAAEEPGLRRRLATIASLLQNSKVSVEAKVEIGTNWVETVKRTYQPGDMIVCSTEQRVGVLHRPLSQILQSSLNAPMYILSGQPLQYQARSNWFSQIMAGAGAVGIIIGSTFLQIRITSLPQDGVQALLLILSMIGEIWAIWGWNNLFS